jgi:hypothetical protein
LVGPTIWHQPAGHTGYGARLPKDGAEERLKYDVGFRQAQLKQPSDKERSIGTSSSAISSEQRPVELRAVTVRLDSLSVWQWLSRGLSLMVFVTQPHRMQRPRKATSATCSNAICPLTDHRSQVIPERQGLAEKL